jgi:FtsZ-interacting cell division protein ZipA
MGMESLQWIFIIAGVLAALGVYGYSREVKKEESETTKQADPSEGMRIDPLFDDMPTLQEEENTSSHLIDIRRKDIEESIVFHVFAREGTFFKGEDLRKEFEKLKLQRTTNHFFVLVNQYYPLYQVCSSFKPGYFPEKGMDSYKTKGITFFMTLPVHNAKESFEKMLLDIHQISLKLGGRILDEDRNNLNNQMMNHIRDRIVKYSLKP